MLKRLIRRLRRPVQTAPLTVYEGRLLAGKTMLVTGAGGWLGGALIDAFQKQRATVYFTDLDPLRVQTLESQFSGAKGIAIDIRDTDGMLDWLDSADIRPDILINNVGISAEKHLFQETNADAETIFETNVLAPLRLTKAVAQRIIANNIAGSILFITSVHQTIPSRWPSYSASKAALNMIIKETAIELAPHNIRVNGIAPGWTQTGSHPFRQALLGQSAIDPSYIGHAAVFLCCNALSRFTTGTTLTVDAGMSLYSGRTISEPPR